MNKQYMIQGLDTTGAGWTNLHGFYKDEIKNTDEEMIKYVKEKIFNDPHNVDTKLHLVIATPIAYSESVTEKDKNL